MLKLVGTIYNLINPKKLLLLYKGPILFGAKVFLFVVHNKWNQYLNFLTSPPKRKKKKKSIKNLLGAGFVLFCFLFLFVFVFVFFVFCFFFCGLQEIKLTP